MNTSTKSDLIKVEHVTRTSRRIKGMLVGKSREKHDCK